MPTSHSGSQPSQSLWPRAAGSSSDQGQPGQQRKAQGALQLRIGRTGGSCGTVCRLRHGGGSCGWVASLRARHLRGCDVTVNIVFAAPA